MTDPENGEHFYACQDVERYYRVAGITPPVAQEYSTPEMDSRPVRPARRRPASG